jgi:hypothetical protein
VLNMLVSTASFLPIIIVGPISDIIGTTTVMFIVGIAILLAGVASVLFRAQVPDAPRATADPHVEDPIAAALGHDLPRWRSDDAPSSPVPQPEGPVVAAAPVAPLAPTAATARTPDIPSSTDGTDGPDGRTAALPGDQQDQPSGESPAPTPADRRWPRPGDLPGPADPADRD